MANSEDPDQIQTVPLELSGLGLHCLLWYIGLLRYFQIEIARDFGDANKPRAWSKYSKESSANQRMTQEKQEVEEDETESAKKSKKVLMLKSFFLYKNIKKNGFSKKLPGPVAWSDACPTGIQEVTGSILQSGNILSWRSLI